MGIDFDPTADFAGADAGAAAAGAGTADADTSGHTLPNHELQALLEQRCRRLEALISQKENRLNALREARGSHAAGRGAATAGGRGLDGNGAVGYGYYVGPDLNEGAGVDVGSRVHLGSGFGVGIGIGGIGDLGFPSPPPARRQSSLELIHVPPREQNTELLGRLQTGGRREYTGPTVAAARGVGAIGGSPCASARSALQPSGLPPAVVASWAAGSLSADLTLRSLLDAVSRGAVANGSDSRELSCMSAAHLAADGPLGLGGALGSLAGGLPGEGVEGAPALEPMRGLLKRPAEQVSLEALRLFTKEMLTGAEADSSRTRSPRRSAASGSGAALERRRLCADLCKLSAEEVNLAFRRACLQQHPNRPGGSLAGLLRVHFLFELVRRVWATLPAQGADRRERCSSGSDGASVAAVGSDSEAFEDAAQRGDEVVQHELGLGEQALVAEAASLDGDALDALNEQLQARAMWWCRARDLLDAQLEAMEAVGAYAVLGISADADDKELAAAYRDAARRTHPDRGGDKAKFQQLQAAYQQIVMMRKAGVAVSGSVCRNSKGGGSRGGRGGNSKSGKCGAGKAASQKSGSTSQAPAPADMSTDKGKPTRGPSSGSVDADTDTDADADAAADADAIGDADPDAIGDADANGTGDIAGAAKDDSSEGLDESNSSATPPESGDDADDSEDAAHDATTESPGASFDSDLSQAAAEAAAEAEAAAARAEAALSDAEARVRRREVGGGIDHDGDTGDSSVDGRASAASGDSGTACASPSAAAAAAEAEAAAAVAALGEDSEEEGELLSAEALCRAAEAAAEAARACAASARIGKRVCELGGGGWEVLCDCAQCVLRACRNAAAAAAKVGRQALEAPAAASDAVDEASGRKLGKRAEREVRSLMESMLVAVRQGRCATLAASLCSAKAGEAASLILSLARLPPDSPAMRLTLGDEQLLALMRRVAEVLSDMSAAVGEAAEHAMSTAIAASEVSRKADVVRKLAGAAEELAAQGNADGDSDAEADAKSDEQSKEQKEKEVDAEANSASGEHSDEGGGGGNGNGDGDGNGEGGGEGVVDESALTPSVKKRLETARWLKKLALELSVNQQRLKELACSTPQLLPGVHVAQKEALFDQLSEVLHQAEAPIVRHWYEVAGRVSTNGGGSHWEHAVGEWLALVRKHLAFVFVAADPQRLPVPDSLAARLLRHAAAVDVQLTAELLRSQLLHRALLFAPSRKEAREPLTKQFEEAIASLAKHFAPGVRL